MPTDRAQGTEAIRAALETGYAVSISDPRPSRSEALAALDRLVARIEAAEQRLEHIRPILDEEWAAMMREHDVVDEARRLSRAPGEINTTARLDRALKRYDEALEASASARAAPGETEQTP